MAVWVFVGNRARFPSAVFAKKADADRWIRSRRVSGTLTRYPLDTAIYDWAVGRRIFTPKGPRQATPDFVARFTSAAQKHFHYDAGAANGNDDDEDGRP
jgi:hypothetical protein